MPAQSKWRKHIVSRGSINVWMLKLYDRMLLIHSTDKHTNENPFASELLNWCLKLLEKRHTYRVNTYLQYVTVISPNNVGCASVMNHKINLILHLNLAAMSIFSKIQFWILASCRHLQSLPLFNSSTFNQKI
jgi:hypothetical protein